MLVAVTGQRRFTFKQQKLQPTSRPACPHIFVAASRRAKCSQCGACQKPLRALQNPDDTISEGSKRRSGNYLSSRREFVLDGGLKVRQVYRHTGLVV